MLDCAALALDADVVEPEAVDLGLGDDFAADFELAEASALRPEASCAAFAGARSEARGAACANGPIAARLTASTPLKNRFRFNSRSPQAPGVRARSASQESFDHLRQLFGLVVMDIVAGVFDVLDAQMLVGHRATLKLAGHG